MLVGALLLSMPAAAQNLLGDFGDWILMGDDTMSLALTTDGENIAFGLVCGPDCHIYIEPHEPCTEAQAYPVTFETGAGALQVTMTCTASEGDPLLVMDQDERFLPLIAKQERLRVTIAREGGRLSRFDFPLAGSEKAIGLALAASGFIVTPMDPAGLDRIAGPAARERLQ
ncbi:hypothetical protein [Sphingopyxis fribergensis]